MIRLKIIEGFCITGILGEIGTEEDTNSREPVNIMFDNTTNLPSWTENMYQDAFNDMVESVAEYKGFYVGRYETSLNGSVAQSKSGANPMVDMNWHDMYVYSKTYSTSNTNLGVVSDMIWGCQWDAMLQFILDGEDSSHVTEYTNVSHDLSSAYKTGGTNYSGAIKYNDKAANIYDLEGNVVEWTQLAPYGSEEDRAYNGGSYDRGVPPRGREMRLPDTGASNNGSRLSLYVKL